MKDYIYKSFGLALTLSVFVTLLIAAGSVVAAFAAVAVPAFLLLFPLVLLTKPAITRAAKSANKALTAWIKSKTTVPLD